MIPSHIARLGTHQDTNFGDIKQSYAMTIRVLVNKDFPRNLALDAVGLNILRFSLVDLCLMIYIIL
jgi:hypothetical protein